MTLKSFPQLWDAAKGTALPPRIGSPEQVVLDHPAVVTSVHRQHLAAGAQALRSATFAIPFSDPKSCACWQEKAFQAAADACRQEECRVPIFCALGPSHGDRWSWDGSINSLFDGVVLETFLRATDCASATAQLSATHPVISGLTFVAETTRDGFRPRDAARLLKEAGASALAVTCGVNGELSLDAAKAMLELGLPVLFSPSLYTSVHDFVRLGRRALEMGCAVGGCCGTTAECIAALHPT